MLVKGFLTCQFSTSATYNKTTLAATCVQHAMRWASTTLSSYSLLEVSLTYLFLHVSLMLWSQQLDLYSAFLQHSLLSCYYLALDYCCTVFRLWLWQIRNLTQWRRNKINIAGASRGPKGRNSKAKGLSQGRQVFGEGAYRPSPQLRNLWERWELP